MSLKLVSLTLSLVAISGCALDSVYIPPVEMIHESALFDLHPNAQFADRGNLRSPWPSSDAYFANPENLRYEERIYDIQGNDYLHGNFPIRRFRLIREGSAVR